jgi:hypothetical protein
MLVSMSTMWYQPGINGLMRKPITHGWFM